MTSANAYIRIHANTTNDLQRAFTNENVGVFPSMCEEPLSTNNTAIAAIIKNGYNQNQNTALKNAMENT